MTTEPAIPPRRVVLVDDTEDIRFLMRMVLERAGYEIVSEAVNGRAGVEQVELHRPDLVLLDVMMPVMSGLEALPLMRAASPASRIIMMSAVADRAVDAATSADRDGWIEKGTSIRTMIAEIEAIMASPDRSADGRPSLGAHDLGRRATA